MRINSEHAVAFVDHAFNEGDLEAVVYFYQACGASEPLITDWVYGWK
jgi:hypothetical protein